MSVRATQSTPERWLPPSLILLRERLRDADEAELLRAVKFLAERYGWLFYHTQDSRRCEPGFPDCVLAKKGVIVLVELKRRGGRLRSEQRQWMEAMGCQFNGNQQVAYAVPKARAFVLYPDNLDDLLAILNPNDGGTGS